MFKFKKQFTAIMVILAVIIMSVQVSMAKSDFVYTAVGDAIAQGVGGVYNSADPNYLTGYDDYFAQELQASVNQEVVLRNVAGRIDTSTDLLNKLLYDENEINAVQDADVITVSVGANNLILPVWPIFQQMFAGLISPEDAYAQIFGSTAAFQAGVDEFKADWPQIIDRLHKLSPHAKIAVTTMYNPFSLNDPLYGLADAYMGQINAEIMSSNYKTDYTVADVHSDFYNYESSEAAAGYPAGYTPLIHMFPDPDVVHPTAAGYQRICSLIDINKLK